MTLIDIGRFITVLIIALIILVLIIVLITVLIIALIILVLTIVLIMMKIMASGMMVMRREDSEVTQRSLLPILVPVGPSLLILLSPARS